MGKPIELTTTQINNLTKTIGEYLHNARYNVVLDKLPIENKTDDTKATIIFSQKAWIKMTALVDLYSTEVQWHATVERQEGTETFVVTDILVFPHECTGASVVSNQKEYEAWLDELSDDEFNHLRFHGHSHVNMGVTPSGSFGKMHDGNDDESYRAKIVKGLPHNNDSSNFYIFFIMNKSYDFSARIYDIANNVWFDTRNQDIDVEIEDVDLFKFIEKAQKIAVSKRYVKYVKDTSPTLQFGYDKNWSSKDWLNDIY